MTAEVTMTSAPSFDRNRDTVVRLVDVILFGAQLPRPPRATPSRPGRSPRRE